MSKKQPIGIRIVTESDGYYFHVYAWPVRHDADSDKWEYFPEWMHDPELYGVRTSCQCDKEKSLVKSDSYAWDVDFQVWQAVNLQEAQRAVKAIAPIERRMKKIAEQFGRPQTYGQYVLHFARAIGATEFVYKSRFDDSEQSRRVTDVAFHVDTLIHEFHEPAVKTA